MVAVVVVVCRRVQVGGLRRLSSAFVLSRVVWIDRPPGVGDSRAARRALPLPHPQLPISAHLKCDIGFFFFVTLSLSLHGILYPRPPSDQTL